MARNMEHNECTDLSEPNENCQTKTYPYLVSTQIASSARVVINALKYWLNFPPTKYVIAGSFSGKVGCISVEPLLEISNTRPVKSDSVFLPSQIALVDNLENVTVNLSNGNAIFDAKNSNYTKIPRKKRWLKHRYSKSTSSNSHVALEHTILPKPTKVSFSNKGRVWIVLLIFVLLSMFFGATIFPQSKSLDVCISKAPLQKFECEMDLIVRQYIGQVLCNYKNLNREYIWILQGQIPLTLNGMPLNLARQRYMELFPGLEHFEQHFTRLKSNILGMVTSPLNETHVVLTTTSHPFYTDFCFYKMWIQNNAELLYPYSIVGLACIALFWYALLYRLQYQAESAYVQDISKQIINVINNDSSRFRTATKDTCPKIKRLQSYFFRNRIQYGNESLPFDDETKIFSYLPYDTTRQRIWEMAERAVAEMWNHRQEY
jgi:hypothetical protein